MALNYHLMHPGGDSAPGDPNAAFYLDGTYHLHYILRQMWQGERSFCFVHVTSPDMLHWTWQATKLQPSFTGHGMFSGTGFITKEGQPATIYHGQASQRNHIALAKDRTLSAWEKPFPVKPKISRWSRCGNASLGSRLLPDWRHLLRHLRRQTPTPQQVTRFAALELCWRFSETRIAGFSNWRRYFLPQFFPSRRQVDFAVYQPSVSGAATTLAIGTWRTSSSFPKHTGG